jgi:Retinoblastoma-associated protein B domain
MPFPLKTHFKDIEIKIISHLAWQANSPLPNKITELMSESTPKIESAIFKHTSYQVFFSKVVQYVAQTIENFCEQLGVDQAIREMVWEVMQYVMSAFTGLLIEHHLDQLIMCTIYGICKCMKKDITFNKIITCYIEQKKNSQAIIYHVNIQGGESKDLIEYYNRVFIKATKDIIISIFKNIKIDNKIIKLPTLAPQSPLIQIVKTPVKGKSPSTSSFKPSSNKTNSTSIDYKGALINKIFGDEKQPVSSSQGGKPPLIPKSTRSIYQK